MSKYCPNRPLTISEAGNVLDEGLRAIEAGSVEIDLGHVNSVDSAGVAVLLAWCRAARARGVTLIFEEVPETLKSLAALYGVSEFLRLSKN